MLREEFYELNLNKEIIPFAYGRSLINSLDATFDSSSDFELKIYQWGHSEGVEYRKSFHSKANQYHMRCLHYGEYTTKAKKNPQFAILKQ